MPDEAMWKEFRELLKKHPAESLIWEGKPDLSIAQKLKDLGVASVVVDPCGNAPDTGDFLSVMRENLETLRRACAVN
jgi:zinc transport system substrate-binding protein